MLKWQHCIGATTRGWTVELEFNMPFFFLLMWKRWWRRDIYAGEQWRVKPIWCLSSSTLLSVSYLCLNNITFIFYNRIRQRSVQRKNIKTSQTQEKQVSVLFSLPSSFYAQISPITLIFLPLSYAPLLSSPLGPVISDNCTAKWAAVVKNLKSEPPRASLASAQPEKILPCCLPPTTWFK